MTALHAPAQSPTLDAIALWRDRPPGEFPSDAPWLVMVLTLSSWDVSLTFAKGAVA